MIPPIIWLIFLFMLGASVGSFLNVVVWRLPQEMSLVKPGSHCPSCKHPLSWYDNVPVFAWFYLGGKCRYCKVPYSFKYPFFEFMTGAVYSGLYWLYFMVGIRENMPVFEQGGWLIYGAHIVLISCLLAGSLIDAEHFIIPLSISYFMVVVGLLASGFESRALEYNMLPMDQWKKLVPFAGPKIGAMAVGSSVGLLISFLLLKFGYINRSFLELEKWELAKFKAENEGKEFNEPEPEVNVRGEMVRELAFLCMPVVLGFAVMKLLTQGGTDGGAAELSSWWSLMLIKYSWLNGTLGSIYGFMIGAVTVWATRIFGSIMFNKEAMGLGDVHLMAGVGAILGWYVPLIAFFIAPFVGIGWAVVRLITKQQREIPYGPFLSIAVIILLVMHDSIITLILQNLLNVQVK